MISRRILASLSLIAAVGAAAPQAVNGTPSTECWAPSSADIQPYKVWHLTIDNYFTLGRAQGKSGAFPTDIGLTVGVLPYKKLNLEVGFDWLEPGSGNNLTRLPLFLNAKLGLPEGMLFPNAPAVAVGGYNFGVKKGTTDQNILYGAVTKSVPEAGRFSAGYYVGNGDILKDGTGKESSSGVLVAYDRPIVKDKLFVVGDWQSGKNAVGAAGFGLTYFFAPNVDVIFGYVVFNDNSVNGQDKVTTQLDINFP